MKKSNQHVVGLLVRISGAFMIFFIMLFSTYPQSSFGDSTNSQEKKVVKVGYYLYEGYQEVDENGVYSGYGYDYLKEISQFAGWDYEFVVATFPECIRMLENGEVDIVGSIDKGALKSNKIEYSHFSNRVSQTQLYTKATNTQLNFDDFTKFDGLCVGVLKDDYQESYLDEYSRQNHIALNKKYYKTLQHMEAALENDEVQAIFTSVESNIRYDKVIGRMDERPLYYGVNKNNQQLLGELNQSMQNIKNSNPSYDMQIQNKYFIKGNVAAPSFTVEELKYIEEKDTVKLSYDQGWQPIEYYDEETGDIKGVTKDLFDLLSKYTGLKFEFVRAKDLSHALNDVKTDKTDMISLVSHDYAISEKRGLYTSSICINASLVGVIAKDKNFDGIKQIAMPKDYYLDILENYEVKEYETVEDCFEAVNSGEADATIANAYSANYYLANPKFVNLIRQDLIGYSEDLSLLRNEAERDLLTGLFNRRKIESELKEFLLKISVDNQMSLQSSNFPNKDIHSLMILNLDVFKIVNDRYGHPEGDTLLKKVAKELELVSGEENLVGRLGGDEFVFLFKNITGISEALHLAENIHKVIGEISKEDEKWSTISVSVGVTLFSYETYSFKELYQKVDQALYKAKQLGKDRVVFYEEL